MQRFSSDWPDPDEGDEEEASDRVAVAVSVGSDIRRGERELYTAGDERYALLG
jgi:hypothetical protein